MSRPESEIPTVTRRVRIHYSDRTRVCGRPRFSGELSRGRSDRQRATLFFPRAEARPGIPRYCRVISWAVVYCKASLVFPPAISRHEPKCRYGPPYSRRKGTAPSRLSSSLSAVFACDFGIWRVPRRVVVETAVVLRYDRRTTARPDGEVATESQVCSDPGEVQQGDRGALPGPWRRLAHSPHLHGQARLTGASSFAMLPSRPAGI